MAQCKAFGCTNNKRINKNKKYFCVPKPTTDEKRVIAKKWLHNLGTGHTLKTFTFSRNSVVCEDHFEPDCYARNMQAELMGYPARTTLKPDAVPTIFVHRQLAPSNTGRDVRVSKRDKRKLLHELSRPSAAASVPPPQSPSSSDCDSVDPVPMEEADPVYSNNVCHSAVQTDPVQIFPAEAEVCVLEAGTQVLLTKRASQPVVAADHCYSMKQSDNPSPPPAAATDASATLTNTAVDIAVDWFDHDGVAAPVDHQSTLDIAAETVIDSTVHRLPVLTSTPVKRQPPKYFLDPCSPVAASSTVHMESTDEESTNIYDTDSADEHLESRRTIDASWLTSGHSDSNDCSIDDNNTREFWTQVHGKKFVVFEECIDKLVRSTVCTECKSPVNKMSKVVSGTNIVVHIQYLCNHDEVSWSGQTFTGKGNSKIASGNLLLSAATLYTGLTYTRVKKLADFINLAFISESTFYSFQRDILLPVINERWLRERQCMVNEAQVSDGKLTLAGDGRCDSPGFCAKYCTYSFMESESDKILDFELVQVTQTGTSQSMEKYGFCKVLDRLLEEGVPVGTVATDRHVGIRSVMNKEYSGSGIDHQFDVFHMASSIKKKLKELTKKKKHEDLCIWVRSILNHVWFSSRTCDGNPDKMVELFTSVTYHVAGIHRWSGNTYVNQCGHQPMTKEEQQEKLWLKGPSLLALKDILLAPKLVKDIRQLSLFCHTGKLETFHSKLLVFCPKRQEFDFQCMLGRTQLAVLDHNANVGRDQAVVREANSASASVGDRRFRQEYKKHSGAYHARPTYVPTSQDHLQGLAERALEVRSLHIALPVTAKPAAKNITMKQAPPKKELIAKENTRF